MTRAVLPLTSASAEWPLATGSPATLDPSTPLGGGYDDEDAEAGTYTTVPDDDNDDIASLTCQRTTSIQTSNLSPLGAVCSLMYPHCQELEVLFEEHGVCSGVVTDSLVLQRTVYDTRALVQPLFPALQLANRQK